jgi:hypothetical protein
MALRCKRSLRAFPGFCVIQPDLAPSPSNLGNRLAELGCPAEARRAGQEAVAIRRELVCHREQGQVGVHGPGDDRRPHNWHRRPQFGLGLETEFREQGKAVHVGEDPVMCDKGNTQPDCRGGHPSVGLMILAAQAVPVLGAPRTHGGIGLGEIRTRPDGAGPGEFVVQANKPGRAPACQLGPYLSSATVMNEMTAGRPSRRGRYAEASDCPRGVRRAPNTPVSMITGPREPGFTSRGSRPGTGGPRHHLAPR